MHDKETSPSHDTYGTRDLDAKGNPKCVILYKIERLPNHPEIPPVHWWQCASHRESDWAFSGLWFELQLKAHKRKWGHWE